MFFFFVYTIFDILRSSASNYRKIWRTRRRAFLRMVGEYGSMIGVGPRIDYMFAAG